MHVSRGSIVNHVNNWICALFCVKMGLKNLQRCKYGILVSYESSINLAFEKYFSCLFSFFIFCAILSYSLGRNALD